MPHGRIRIGIAGVGNCASPLVQGVNYYGGMRENEPLAGPVEFSGYRSGDIAVACAFGVVRNRSSCSAPRTRCSVCALTSFHWRAPNGCAVRWNPRSEGWSLVDADAVVTLPDSWGGRAALE